MGFDFSIRNYFKYLFFIFIFCFTCFSLRQEPINRYFLEKLQDQINHYYYYYFNYFSAKNKPSYPASSFPLTSGQHKKLLHMRSRHFVCSSITVFFSPLSRVRVPDSVTDSIFAIYLGLFYSHFSLSEFEYKSALLFFRLFHIYFQLKIKTKMYYVGQTSWHLQTRINELRTITCPVKKHLASCTSTYIYQMST